MTTPESVDKLMSLTAHEFIATLAHLGPSSQQPDGVIVFRLDGGSVRIRFKPQPSVTLGGLLALPRAKVTLTFDGAADDARTAFLKRFDLAFKRGGG
jgi:hypothetical protein